MVKLNNWSMESSRPECFRKARIWVDEKLMCALQINSGKNIYKKIKGDKILSYQRSSPWQSRVGFQSHLSFLDHRGSRASENPFLPSKIRLLVHKWLGSLKPLTFAVIALRDITFVSLVNVGCFVEPYAQSPSSELTSWGFSSVLTL